MYGSHNIVATAFIAKLFRSLDKYISQLGTTRMPFFSHPVLILHWRVRPSSRLSRFSRITNPSRRIIPRDQRYTHVHTMPVRHSTFECHRTLLRGWHRVGCGMRWPDISITPRVLQSATTTPIYEYSLFFFPLAITSVDPIYRWIILIVCT